MSSSMDVKSHILNGTNNLKDAKIVQKYFMKPNSHSTTIDDTDPL